MSEHKIFDKVGLRRPRMSAFDLSREQKLSCKMGELIPTYLEEVLPGDQFKVKTECMMRLAPMLAPVMHRVNVYMHYFYVPNRIIWNQWEDFITGGRDGTSEPVFPVINMTNAGTKTRLADHLGIPPHDGGGEVGNISALPFRAYQMIWNEYYRDETLQDPVDIHTALGTVLGTLRRRSWEKDYFTSALPFAQRGPSIGTPLNIEYMGHSDVQRTNDTDPTDGDIKSVSGKLYSATDEAIKIENIDFDGSGIDINDLRRSSALQRFLEKQARGGYRYIETLFSHFGKKVPDSRLQRPEYLGGGRQPIVISEVLNTTGTTSAPQGDMTGHGISVGVTNSFRKEFEEHGYVIGILSVLPRTAYQQGIHRHWLRRDKFDFYWPEFANLGEQEVKNVEVFYDKDDGVYNDGTFGYQQRYAEMKYGCSTVHGEFRSSLDFWHMGRIFGSRPSLNETFVMSIPTTRIFAVEEGDHLWIQLYHDVKARRPMPYFADPRLT